jgi:hypothetical protein
MEAESARAAGWAGAPILTRSFEARTAGRHEALSRHAARRRSGRRLAQLCLALLVTGCTTLSPVQQSELHQVREFVEATGRVYGVPALYVMTGDTGAGVGGIYRSGQLILSERFLRGNPYRDAIVAHELGHYLLGHDQRGRAFDDRPVTLADWARAQEPKELDANAKAVEILVRVKGWGESSALRVMLDFLSAAAKAQARGGLLAPGHPPACAEIHDLAKRFPAQQAVSQPYLCARSQG